ncbi:MAG: hypothetical protein ACC641_02475 [Acidiferrobacterales bacterium]
MDQKIILRKTEKGNEELETREHRLSPALRMVLILVDGKSDVAALKNKASGLKELEKYLEELVSDGYIRDQNDFTEDSPAPQPVRELGAESLATMAKWEIVNMVKNVIGGEFGQRATDRFMNIEDTPNALRGALEECYNYVLLTIDDKKAAAVKQKGAEILSKL